MKRISFSLFLRFFSKKGGHEYPKYMKKMYFCKTTIFATLAMLHISINKVFAQTTTQNYIVSETMLDSTGFRSMKSVQYFDGLGRPNVLATGGVNTSGKYLYTLQQYDSHGRDSTTWLPAVGSTSPVFLTDSEIATKSNATYSDNQAYSTMTYDPLDRPILVSTPGTAWDNKGVTTNYVTNAANSVKKYVVTTTGGVSQSGYYAEAALTGVERIDEDGHSIITFNDLAGNVVLERRNGNNDTYYVYSQGLLRVVVPPQYQETGEESLLYKYTYNARGQLIQKRLPGCAVIQYWYDKYGRLAFMQDGRMRAASCYRFYLYDELSRLVLQGICTGGSMGGSLPATATFLQGSPGFEATSYKLHTSYQIESPSLEIANYYDGYTCVNTTAMQAVKTQMGLTATSNVCTTGLLTAQIIKASNGEKLYRVMYYDERGRLTDVRESFLNKIVSKKTTNYSFTDKPLTSKTVFTVNGNPYHTITDSMVYDLTSDLLLKETLRIGTYNPVQVLSNSYSELGRLSGSTYGPCVVGNMMAYNLHGWPTVALSVNMKDSYKTLFEEILHYVDGEGMPCYNGNISSLNYKSANLPNNYYGYKYTYDGLDRLTSSTYCMGTYMAPINTKYCETMTYNKNSALKTLWRTGRTNSGYGMIDNLTYTYDGNQLKSVEDSVSAPMVYSGAFEFKDGWHTTAEYVYDECGALTQDKNKGIAMIDYDFNGMPTRIQFMNGSVIENVYSAEGVKLKSIHRTAVSGLHPVYYGIRHTLTAAETLSVDSTIYVNNLEIDRIFGSKYYFGNGYIALGNTGSGTFHYTIKDHLGNIRTVVNNSGSIEQINNYFAYGGLLNDITTGTDVQIHKYNSKELDRMYGLDLYDYGARNYDAVLGMFTTVDPLCEKCYHISPYAYCGGNPMNRVDPDGQNPIYAPNGRFLGTDDLGLQGHYYVMDEKYFTQGMSHFDVGKCAVMGNIPRNVEKIINNHYEKLPERPDYDGFVTVGEGIAWAKSHPNALKNPTPDNTLYIDASQLDFGSISTTDFPKEGVEKAQNLFNNDNILESSINATLLSTVYALGRVNMILTNRPARSVQIVNDSATDYDWNVGGGWKRNTFIQTNNTIFGINPKIHGFKAYYYGTGTLRK